MRLLAFLLPVSFLLCPPVIASDLMLVVDNPDTPMLDVIVLDEAPAGTPTPVGLTTHDDRGDSPDFVNFSGGLPGWMFAVSTAIVPDPESPRITVSSVQVSMGDATLRVIACRTFDLPAQIIEFGVGIGGNTDGEVKLVEDLAMHLIEIDGLSGNFSDGATIDVMLDSGPAHMQREITLSHGPGVSISGWGSGN